mmetsp:Transcript_6175/g.17268  ORF Transcript_6175/g.17268 Transcript_6175/m.17268 type:complete len:407 (+) Transcript_6175:2-1222(+)
MTRSERMVCMELISAMALRSSPASSPPHSPSRLAPAGGRRGSPKTSPPPSAPTGAPALAPPPGLPVSAAASPQRSAKVVQTLASLASFSPASRAAIGRAGGVETLTQLLERAATQQERADAVSALFALVPGSPENEGALAATGSVAALATVAADANATAKSREQAVHLIGVLAKSHGTAVADGGGVDVLVPLLGDSSPAACGFAVFALRHIAKDIPHSHVAIIRAGAVPLLVRLIADDMPDDARNNAADLLEALAAGDEQVRTAVIIKDGVAALARALNGGAPHISRRSASALVRLAASSEPCRKAVVCSGSIARLASLLEVPEAEVEHAVLSAGVVPLLLKIAQGGAQLVRAHAATALLSIAEGSSEGRKAIWDAGGALALATFMRERSRAVSAQRHFGVVLLFV